MRASNPTLNENTFNELRVSSPYDNDLMTLDGTVNKTSFLLILVVTAAYFAWDIANPLLTGGCGIVGLILALVTVFKKEWSPITTPLYAAVEGVALGGISAMFEAKFPGIVFQAVLLTFGTFAGLLMAYQSKMIKATENFKLGVMAATAGIALVYLVSFVMSFFGTTIPYIHEAGLTGILFSGFVVVIAALNLVLDFDFIENAVNKGVPKYMEWYASFGLLVTLIWLYIEILKLIAKSRSRR